MSRSIHISYRDKAGTHETSIEVQAPYFLFGTQGTSMGFWSLSIFREIGVTRLAELGFGDPIYFSGWDMMEDLSREISLWRENLGSINFEPEIKAQWLSHLVYCHALLTQTAPKDTIPELTIG